MIGGWDLVIATAAFVLMMALLLPVVPFWAWYAFTVIYTFTRILDILEHGWSTKRALVMMSSAMIAAFGWWYGVRRKRRTEGENK